jgi:Dolichyl-phosphate-mannose-protein mannosyltransferase
MKRPGDRVAVRFSRNGILLALIALASLGLNLVGNSWGTPDRWHPDEMDGTAAALIAQKTLNPHFFPYGGLHYYVIALTAAAPVGAYNYIFDRKPPANEEDKLQAWRARKDARVQILARSVSAVLAALTVLLTYRMGTLLFTTSTGLLAAAILAVCSYFVLIAHFATVDSAANFWYWLACLLALLGWKRGRVDWYMLAAFTIGLACGTKMDRLLAVIPWVTAILLREPNEKISLGRIARWAALIPIGYVTANPTLLLSFFEFAEGTSTDLIFNTLRGSGTTGFAALLMEIGRGMGWPLFALTACGLLSCALHERRHREVLWLLTALVPMYLVFGSRFAMPWYCPFFYPGLAIIAAQGAVGMYAGRTRAVRLAVAAAVGIALLWSLLSAIAVDQQFLHDSRYAAAAWIEMRVAPGSRIEVSRRGPLLAGGRYILQHDDISQEYYADAQDWSHNLHGNALYRIVTRRLQDLALWSGHKQSQTYKPWFERVIRAKATAPVGAALPEPQFRVIVDYLDESALQQLQRPTSGYRLLAKFLYQQPLGLDLTFPFVNPTTYIFERVPPRPLIDEGNASGRQDAKPEGS